MTRAESGGTETTPWRIVTHRGKIWLDASALDAGLPLELLSSISMCEAAYCFGSA